MLTVICGSSNPSWIFILQLNWFYYYTIVRLVFRYFTRPYYVRRRRFQWAICETSVWREDCAKTEREKPRWKYFSRVTASMTRCTTCKSTLQRPTSTTEPLVNLLKPYPALIKEYWEITAGMAGKNLSMFTDFLHHTKPLSEKITASSKYLLILVATGQVFLHVKIKNDANKCICFWLFNSMFKANSSYLEIGIFVHP